MASAAFLWGWVALCPPAVHAQSAAAPTGYRQLIDSALRDYDAKHFSEARAQLEQAHRLWPSARTLRGLGKVSFELGHYRAAVNYLVEAQRSTVQPLSEAMRQDALQLENRARGYLTQVDVRIEPASARLIVDGSIESLSSKLPLPLDPGEHSVEVTAPGYSPARLAYSLKPSENALWSIQLQRVPVAAALPPTDAARAASAASPSGSAALSDRPNPRGWLLPSGLALSFLGVASVGVGAGFFASYLDDGERFRGAVSQERERSYQSRWIRGHNRVLALTGIGSGLLALGGAALADTIPRSERRWLSPALFAAGAGLLASGLILYGHNTCDARPGETFQACSRGIERADAGTLMAMLSAPLLTIPIVHAAEWLFSNE